jgi:hypothetical protein
MKAYPYLPKQAPLTHSGYTIGRNHSWLVPVSKGVPPFKEKK